MPSAGSDMADAGNPGLDDGDHCSADPDCAHHHCVDGYCCNVACEGQCEACDGATPGTCAAVQGVPHGSRTACSGAGTCGGTCDGTKTDTCAYPSTSTICGAACDSHCDGAGTCPAGSGTCPGGFACGMGACKTSCQGDGDCQTNFTCQSNMCVRIAESDCLDGVDNNGDGLADCADPTCLGSKVECVTAPPDGGEVGQLTSDACAGDYGPQEPQHQGVHTKCDVGNCGCTSQISCSDTISLYPDETGAPSCSSMDHVTSTQTYTATLSHDLKTVLKEVFGACQFVLFGSSIELVSYSLTTPILADAHCNEGSNGKATVTWDKTSNFCAAKRISNSCASNQVCVAKPPSGGLCIRIPGSTAGCPAGFGTTTGVYFGDNSQPTCTCGCTLNSGSTCSASPSATVDLFSDGMCAATDLGELLSSTPACSNQYWDPKAFQYKPMSNLYDQILSFSLHRTSYQVAACNDTLKSEVDAQGTIPSTICCQ